MEEIKELKKKGRPSGALNKNLAKHTTFKERYANPEFKEKQKNKLKELKHCELCHVDYTYVNHARHIKTKRHLNNLPIIDEDVVNQNLIN